MSIFENNLLRIFLSGCLVLSSILLAFSCGTLPVHALSPNHHFQYLSSPPELAAAGAGTVKFSAPAWAFATGVATAVSEPQALTQMSFFDAPAGHKSQDGEDEYAYTTFFMGKRGGLILESGALDGDQFSVSWFFARNLAWRAVHVEGSPDNYARLVVNRPEALNIHSALCNSSRTLHYASRHGGSAVSGFWEFMPEWIQRFYDPSERTDAAIAALPLVACRPLGPLLALWGITHVDFWVLDVEGAEEEVLATFDFARVQVDVIVIELDGANGPKDDRCRAILRSHGYTVKHQAVRNDWFVREGFKGMSSG